MWPVCSRLSFNKRVKAGSSSTIMIRFLFIVLLLGSRARVTTTPPSGTFLTSMAPWWRSMIFFTTDSPKPVPTPTGLVVKNGSKILARWSGAMPGPLSWTSATTSRSPGRNSPTGCRSMEVFAQTPGPGREQEGAPLFHGLEGVDEEIQQHLLHLARIHLHAGQTGLQTPHDFGPGATNSAFINLKHRSTTLLKSPSMSSNSVSLDNCNNSRTMVSARKTASRMSPRTRPDVLPAVAAGSDRDSPDP